MQPMDRRALLGGLGAAAAATIITPAALGRTRRRLFQRLHQPIGLQVGALGAIVARDIDATLAKVAQIGFREIELPNLLGLQPAAWAAAATRAGLTITSLHLPLQGMGGAASQSMLSEPARIADTMGILGAKWAVAPILMFPANFRPAPGESLEATITRTIAAAGEDIWKQTAEALNRKGEALRPLGIGVAYHNHNLDFAPIGKTTGWEILWRETQADLVGFELDIGWVKLAGLDPGRFIEKARGRIKLLHVRDISASQPQGYRIAMGSPIVGAGSLEWALILPAAYRAGARHFLVEQEPQSGTAPMAAAERAFAYLSQLRT